MSTDDPVSSEQYGWSFPDLGSRESGQGGDLTQFAIEGDLETFVREVLQNSNDAADPDADEPVEVTFRIKDLEGDALDRYRRAFGWSDWKAQVEAAAEQDNEIARRIRRYVDEIEERGSLRILVVEDRHTQGLTGKDQDTPETDSTNFSALVRDSLESNKSGDTAGGKFGLGKAVLRIFSGVSTVMFNSVFHEPDPRASTPRLIGRCRFPQHYRDGTRHKGQGFFGDLEADDDEHAPAGSVWGDRASALAEALSLERGDDDTPGTSIQVVGFRDLDREERRDLDKLATAIKREAEKWFWPAIWQDQLRVNVKTPDDTYEADIESSSTVRPFLDCVAREESVDELEDDGDVAVDRLELNIPDRVNPDDGHESMPDDGLVELATRLTTTDGREYTDSVAFVRGAGMVVRYWDRSKVVHGDRHFHAVALAGLARQWAGSEYEEVDERVEAFLTDAEPPEHDDWEQTDATRDDYKRGTKRAIDDLKGEIENSISGRVAPNLDRGVRGPDRLANRFPLSNQGVVDTPKGSSNVSGNLNLRRDADTGRWEFDARVSAADAGDVVTSLTVEVPRMGEDGQSNDYVMVDRVPVLPEDWSADYGGDGVEISGRGGKSDVYVEGETLPDDVNSQTRLNVEATVKEVDE
jgi:hypothetical protein